MSNKTPKDLEDKIVNLYKCGDSVLSVSKKTRVSRGCVMNVLTRKEIKIRPGKTQSPSLLDSLSEIDIAYIAGFFDGEGCVCVHHAGKETENKKSIYILTATIANTNKSVMDYLHSVLGGYIAENNKIIGCKTCYVLHFNSRKAYKLLEKLLPYLRVKKKQAELTMKLRDIITNKKRRKLNDEDIKERELIRQEMLELNKRFSNKNIERR